MKVKIVRKRFDKIGVMEREVTHEVILQLIQAEIAPMIIPIIRAFKQAESEEECYAASNAKPSLNVPTPETETA